jgi:hypothetical protein
MPLAGTNGVILGVVIVVALLAVALVLWNRCKNKGKKEAAFGDPSQQAAASCERAGRPEPDMSTLQAAQELLTVWQGLEEGQKEQAAAVWLRQERGSELIALLGKEDVAAEALVCLWPWLQNDVLRKQLQETLRHETPAAAAATARLAGRLNDTLLVPHFLTALFNSKKYLPARAGEALAACGRPGALAIEALYAKSDGANRESLLEVLAQMPADQVSPELIQKALKDPEGSVRAAAVAAVAAWQLPNGVALLKPLCKDGDRLVLAAVATALGDFSSKTAKSLLESMNAGGDWAIEAAIKSSLARLAPPEEPTEPSPPTSEAQAG